MRIAALLVCLSASLLAAQEKATKQQLEASAGRLEELQKERIAALKDAAEVSRTLALHARLGVSEALEDRMAFFKALLEATEKESDRIPIYETMIEDLVGLEELAATMVRNARATTLPLFRAKARRLEVEILLEQALMKEGKVRVKKAPPPGSVPAPIPEPIPAPREKTIPMPHPTPARGREQGSDAAGARHPE